MDNLAGGRHAGLCISLPTSCTLALVILLHFPCSASASGPKCFSFAGFSSGV